MHLEKSLKILLSIKTNMTSGFNPWFPLPHDQGRKYQRSIYYVCVHIFSALKMGYSLSGQYQHKISQYKMTSGLFIYLFLWFVCWGSLVDTVSLLVARFKICSCNFVLSNYSMPMNCQLGARDRENKCAFKPIYGTVTIFLYMISSHTLKKINK